MDSNIPIEFQEPTKNETPVTAAKTSPQVLPVDVTKGSEKKSSSAKSKETKNKYLLTESELQLLKEKYYSGEDGGSKLAEAMDTKAYYPENDLAADVLVNKYLAPNEKGPLHLWHRVAKSVASVEDNKQEWYENFFAILKDFKFIPGGRVMHAAGREDARRRPTLSNCYVIPIQEDSLEGIYQCKYNSRFCGSMGIIDNLIP